MNRHFSPRGAEPAGGTREKTGGPVPLRGLFLMVAASFVLAGCASAPPAVRDPGSAAAWLGGQPRVVVRLDARAVRAWGEATQKREALKAVGDRTRVVWLGFELNSLDDLKTAADTVRVVLEGDFPKGAAGLMLDWNSAWKKGAEKGVWTSPKLGLSVSLPDNGLVAVRRHDERPAQADNGVLRDLDPLEVEGASAWISFWTPGQALFGAAGARLVPVDRLDVVLTARDGVLTGPVLLRFADERAARAASVLLKLAGAQIRARFGQDLSWSAEGPVVTGTGLTLKQDDLKTLADQLLADPAPEENP